MSRIMRKPPRTSAWSSARTTPIAHRRPPAAGGRGRGSRRSGSGPASSVPPSIVARSRMPAIPRPPPSADGAVPPRPSSRTSSSSTPGAERTVTSARRGAGVAQRVRQRLLHDPVGRQVDARGQRVLARPRASARPRARRRAAARRARRAGRARAAGAPARRSASGRTAASSRRSSASASRPAGLDRAQRGARLVGALVEDVVGRRRLHDDHRDAVGDHVVQLARDPRLLVADRPARRLLDRDPPVARGLAERPRDDRQERARRSRPPTGWVK